MNEDASERDLKILKNINALLKKDSRFLLTTLNGLRMIRMYNDNDVKEGRFDPLTITVIHPLTELIKDAPSNILIREKGFTAIELMHMFRASGFSVEHIWGGTAGSWKRKPLKMDEMEVMVLSRKIKNID